MASTINGTSTGNGGLISTGDDSGILNIQTNETTAITVDSSQNVGVGTTSPSAKLHVSGGQSYITGASGSGAYSRWYNNAQTTSDFQVGQGWASASDNVAVLNNNANAAMILGTNGTERMRIDSSGSVWFRTTGSVETWNATTGTFAKVGDATYPIGTTAPGLNVILNRNTSTGQIQEFKYNATAVGNISVTGSATAYNTASDYRLKENIAPMTGALAKVAQLKPVTYKWKVDGSDGEGFIAHELAEVCPQAVEGTKDAVDDDGKPMHQSIDTSFLVATLTAALQETKALIDTQAETINALTARIVALEQK